MALRSGSTRADVRRLLLPVFRWVAVGLALLVGAGAYAAQERYDYDPLGRLVRMVDGQGRVTEYIYDAVGNILEVRTGGAAQPPTVTDIAPATLRRGTSATVTVNGTNLSNVEVRAADPQLQISGVSGTATRVTFNLAAGLGAALGAAPVVLRNSLGEVTRSITIQPTLPTLSIAPTPIAIPPDGVARSFSVALSHADVVAHTVSVTSDQPTIASVSPASAVIAAGQTQATFQITGVLGGQTVIRLTSPTLVATAVPVFVTAEFRGINTAYSSIVGVTLAGGAPPPSSTPTSLFSTAVGITRGPVWLGAAPRGLIVGASGTLAIDGVNLPAALTVAVAPATGLTLGTPVVNAEGTRATVPFAVAADAVPGARRLVVQAAGQVIVVATPGADRIDIRALPVVDSVAPIFGTAGTTINPFIIRGTNLFDAQSINFSGAGIVVGAQPTINALGTEITTAIAISPVAAPGARTVTVTTPSGTSETTANSSNTFSVVQTVGETFSSIASPVVGVNLASTVAPVNPSYGLYSSIVGISIGSIVNSVSPATVATGQSLTLVLSGRELAGVSSVTITPPTGITIGAPVIASDGSNVQVPVTVAADAAIGARRLRLLAGVTAIPFAVPGGDRLDVTLPQPVLASVEPIVAQVGTSVGFVLRGSNLLGLSQVKITPSQGVAINTPGVNAAGDIATVVMIIDATAAPGARVISVVTPAGESSTVAGPTNTVTLAATPGTTYPSVTSALVGVQLASNAPPPVTPPTALYSSVVGVEFASIVPPSSSTFGLYSNAVGVALGAVVTGVTPLGVNPGQSANVAVGGIALPANTALAFAPATGITLDGAPVVAPDGSGVTQSITVAADAPQTTRRVQVSAGGVAIHPVSGAELMLAIGPAPEIISLGTILARQGEILSLLIRGSNFRDVLEVFADPASGITFVAPLVVAADGSQIQLTLAIAPDAPLGGRVIRVRTRTGSSSSVAAPANTFTVFPP